jgi:hypothetical protein
MNKQAVSLVVSFNWLLLGCTVHGATSEGSLSLPEPTLVNQFLLTNSSNWTNPLFGDQPQALQVVRCQSLLSGAVYDFYQVQQAPWQGGACAYPPPVLVKSRPRGNHELSLGSKVGKLAMTFYIYISLVFVGQVVVLVGIVVIAVAGVVLLFFLESCLKCFGVERPKGPEPEAAPQDAIEAPTNPPVPVEETPCQAAIRALEESAPDTSADQQAEPDKPAPGPAPFAVEVLFSIIACLLLGSLVAAEGFVSIWSGTATPKALKEHLPQTVTERLGPVSLPDPTHGLNQFLRFNNETELALKLCSTDNLVFYMGLSDSCAQVGDPYAGRGPAEVVGVKAGSVARHSTIGDLSLMCMIITGIPIAFGIEVLGGLVIGKVVKSVFRKLGNAIRGGAVEPVAGDVEMAANPENAAP